MGGGGGCCVGNVENTTKFNCCIGDCCVADSPEKRRAAQIDEELNNAKISADEKGAVAEMELVNCVNESTEELKTFLNQFTVEKYARHALKFDLENLDILTKKFVSELGNFISVKIKKRLVHEDKEVIVILAEPNNDNRKKNLDAFCERLFRNALKDLISKTETFFKSLAESTASDISTLQEKLDDTRKPYKRLDDVREQIVNFITMKKNNACNILETAIAKSKKNFPAKSIRLLDIAKAFDFTISGDDTELEISSLRYAHEAEENSLAIAYSEKDILKTAAQSALTEPRLVPVEKNLLYCGFHELHEAIIKIARLMIAEGIYPDYEKIFEQTEKGGSMFGAGVEVGAGTFIAPFVSVGENVTIGKNCRIESGVFIGSGTQIGDGVKILSGSRVGVNCHYHYEVGGRHKGFCGVGRTIIKDGVEIGTNSVIQRGSFSDTVIGAGTVIGNLVEIAHDVQIGANCLIVSQVGLCGNVTIGDRVQIFGQVGIKDWVTVGDDAIIFSKSRVTKNIRAGQKVSGMFAREHKTELKRLAKLNKIIEGE